MLLLSAVVSGQTYYSQGSSDVNTLSNWNTLEGGGGSSPADFTGTHTWVIQSGHDMTMTGNWTVGETGTATVTIGGSLTVSSAYLVAITGSLTVNGSLINSGTYITACPVTASSGITINGTYEHAQNNGYLPVATWSNGSTCLVTGWTSTASLGNTSFDQPFYNFTWNCSGQSTDVSFGGYVLTVNGTFTLVSSGASYSIYPFGNATYGNYVQTGGAYDLTLGSTSARSVTITNNFSLDGGTFYQSWHAQGTMTIGGNYNQSAGSYFLGATTGSPATVGGDFSLTGGNFNLAPENVDAFLTVGGDFSVSGSSILTMSIENVIGTIKVAGDFSHTAGVIREGSTGNGNIIFNGNVTQRYISGGTLSGTINFTVGEGTNLPTLQMGTGASPAVISSGSDGTFTILPGATLGITSPDGISATGATGNIQLTGTRTFNAGAYYLYCGTTNQVTGTGFPTDLSGRLIINNTGTAGNNTITLDNARTIANGGLIDLIAGILNAGTNLTMASTSSINRSTGILTGTLQGTGLYNVSYSGNSVTTADELTGTGLNSINVALTSGQTLTSDQSRTLAGNLTITSGTLNLGSFTYDRALAGGTLTISDGAVLRIGGTNTLPANFETHTLAPTSLVEYFGGNQTVSGGTYGHMILSGTGNKTIPTATAVTVQGNLTTGDMLTINSESLASNGSLIVNGTCTGTLTYNRQLHTETAAGDYHFFSSPVASNSNTNTGKITDVYRWDEVTAGWPTLSITSLVSGVGYNLDQESSSDGLISFTGTMVASDVIVEASSPYSDVIDGTEANYKNRTWATGRDTTDNWGGGGWNLLGNPYTSAILVSDFLTQNLSQIDPNYQAVYLYDGTYGLHGRYYFLSTTDEWPDGTYSSQTHIQAGQGFFVLVMNDASSFTFNRAMQDHSTSAVMLKSATERKTWPGVQIKAKTGSEENMTTVMYNDDMSYGLDPGYDIGYMSSGAGVEIYTTLVEDNGVNFARQALPLSDNNKCIALGVDTKNGGTVVFSATAVPFRNHKFILEDKVTGVLTNIGRESYTVTLPQNTYGTGRFYIYASYDRDNRTKHDYPPLEDVRIWNSFGRVNIEGQLGEDPRCEVYDSRGNKIFDTRLSGSGLNSFDMPASARGIYFIKVIDGAKTTTKKVVFLQ